MARRRADAPPGLLDRVRWGNVGRLVALLAAGLLLALGPRACSKAPGPEATIEAAPPPDAPAPPPTGRVVPETGGEEDADRRSGDPERGAADASASQRQRVRGSGGRRRGGRGDARGRSHNPPPSRAPAQAYIPEAPPAPPPASPAPPPSNGGADEFF